KADIGSRPEREHHRREHAWAGRLTHRPGSPRRNAVRSSRRATTAPARRPPARAACFPAALLLDSRVVDVPRAYNRTFVMLSSLKPFFFNSLQKELRFSDNAGA